MPNEWDITGVSDAPGKTGAPQDSGWEVQAVEDPAVVAARINMRALADRNMNAITRQEQGDEDTIEMPQNPYAGGPNLKVNMREAANAVPVAGPIIMAPGLGMEQVAKGSGQVADGDVARGAGNIFAGSVKVATPAMLAGALYAPAEALAWSMISQGLGGLAKEGAKQAGANPEDAEEIGDVASSLPLIYGFGRMGLRALAETRAQTQAEIAQHWETQASQRPGAQVAEVPVLNEETGKVEMQPTKVGGLDPIPVRIKGPNGAQDATVDLAGIKGDGQDAGNPIFQVVRKSDGKILFGDTGKGTTEWLRRNVVDPTWLQKWNSSFPDTVLSGEGPVANTEAKTQVIAEEQILRDRSSVYADREAQATEYLQQNPDATIANIQRKFKLGYGRAARVFQAVRGNPATEAAGDSTAPGSPVEPAPQNVNSVPAENPESQNSVPPVPEPIATKTPGHYAQPGALSNVPVPPAPAAQEPAPEPLPVSAPVAPTVAPVRDSTEGSEAWEITNTEPEKQTSPNTQPAAEAVSGPPVNAAPSAPPMETGKEKESPSTLRPEIDRFATESEKNSGSEWQVAKVEEAHAPAPREQAPAAEQQAQEAETVSTPGPEQAPPSNAIAQRESAEDVSPIERRVLKLLAKPRSADSMTEELLGDDDGYEAANQALIDLRHRGMVEMGDGMFSRTGKGTGALKKFKPKKAPGAKAEEFRSPAPVVTGTSAESEPGTTIVSIHSPEEGSQLNTGNTEGGPETNATRRPDSEALETAPAEVREEPGGEGTTGRSGGSGGGSTLGNLQRDAVEGTEPRSGGRDRKGAVDQSGEDERTGPGELTKQTAGRDFRITDKVGVGEGTPRQKLEANLDAIRIVKRLAAENREATPDEQRKLARYIGWGGMPQIFDWGKREWAGAREELQSLLTPEEYKAAEASTKNAHYTSPTVVKAMWQAMERFGVNPGFSVIEPAMGVGNFFGLQSDSLLPARRTGVELDSITAQIAKALYPDSNVIHAGFEKVALPNDFFDAAISNVPFGNYGVYDPKYKKQPIATQAIHNYFFVKGLDLVRPGGIVAFITSRYTMDAKEAGLRKLLHSKADLVGMIRLPDTAFKSNAGTEVVTDVIFLHKRADGAEPAGESFLNAVEVPTADGGTTVVNEYYQAHPEMMLGELRLEGKMYGPGQQTLKGELTPEKFEAAIEKLPQGIYKEWKAETPVFEGSAYVQLGDAVKDGGYDVRDGVVVQREGDLYRPVAKLGKTQEARIRGMIPVRAAVRNVFATQLLEAPEKDIVAARKKLNEVYDGFVKKFGPFQSAANVRALGDDPDYPVLAALEENFDKQTNNAEKAAIFSKRTIEKPKTPEKADTSAEALAITLNERGRLDWDRMQQLTGKTPEEMRAELGGLVYQNPDGRKWETADEYLAGNVREKLELAREAAKADPKFERNVEALEKVQPRDLEPHEIKVTLGAPWIPAEVVADFLKKVLDLEGAKVHYSPQVAAWSLDVPKWVQSRTANSTTYGTEDFRAHELVDLALNGKSPKVYTGPPDKRVVDPRATAVAQAAMMALKEKFKEWIWEQPYASKLAVKYNREMNNLRLVEYDGSHLTLPGSNPAITLRPHQKNVIWRALKTGNTLLAHEVGAGKTWEMVGIAMESRRLGMAKKPMLVVPNHMPEQVATEFAQLYPAARILTVGQDDFAADRRKRSIARIASGAWDAIILRHSSFEKIPVSDETYARFVDSQIADLRAALEEQKAEVGRGAEKDKTVKEIQKAIARLEVKLQKRLAREKKDDAASFEELGVDLLLVDEAHAFKALPIITRRTRVAGIPTRESNRATDMLMKTQYVSGLNGGRRGVIFATGTPVTNTMAELYNMQRYLQPQALKDAGVAHFDAWANTFGEVVRGTELDVSGKGFRENERFAKFINIPELLTMYRQVADVKTAEMMKLPRPDLEGGAAQPITAPETPELTAFIESLIKRAERIRAGQVDKSVDNMLKVVGEGKKAALDMRLIDPEAEDRPDSKVNKAVQNIYDIWKETKADRATQIVFCDLSTPKSSKKAASKKPKPEEGESETSDQVVEEAAGERAGFSVYDDVRGKLIRMGVPSEEIAFIHDYASDEKKQELFDAVNAGKVRVLMGSTEKVGVGTNVQRRAIALHHMDAPWRPADIKQRDGRIQRQGNMHKTVRIYQYLTEGSFDAYMWQLLETKAKFIAPILSGELSVREMEDIGMVLPSAAEFKAIASGNPLIKDKITTDGALARLDAQRNGFRKQQASIKSQLAALPATIEGDREALRKIQADVQTIETRKDDGYTIGKQKFTGEDARKKAGEALHKALDSWRGPGNPQKIGSYNGLELWTRPYTSADAYPSLTLRGASSYNANTNRENPGGTLASIESVVRNIPSQVARWQTSLEEGLKKQAELQKQLGRAWPHEKQYQELLKKKAEIDAQLAESSAEQAAGSDAADTEGATEDRREGEHGSFTLQPDDIAKLQRLFRGRADGEPMRDYSFMGSTKSFFVRNLSQLEEASPEAHKAVVRAASWKAQAATLLRAAWPQVVKALGDDTTENEFRLGLIQSRLYGTRDRWNQLAEATLQTPDDQLLDWVLNGPLQLLAAMSEDGDVAQQAAALASNVEVLPKNKQHRKAYENLRRLVAESFFEAANSVKEMMTQDQFDELIQRPGFQKGLDVYHSEIEPELAESHQRNEGVFSDALGPLDTYYPLVPIRNDDEARAITGARRGFKKPANISNHFATGLADDYDAGMEAFAEKVGAALRVNDKAAAIQALTDAGIIQKLKPGQSAETVTFRGREYKAKVEEAGPARTIVQPDGKVVHVAPPRVAVPEPFWHELKPVLFQDAKLPPGAISRILHAIAVFTLSGPADMVFHSHNLLGALIGNTPWLGEDLATRTIGNTPFTKVFTAIVKIATTDPMDDEALEDLQAMAKLGLLPERFGRETFSKEYALMTGAHLKRWYLGQFGPALYGPKGIDVRARLIMYRLAQTLDPNANSVQLYKFVNQLGNYTEALQGHLERKLKSSGLSPFYTAGSTMIRNGVDTWLGTGEGSGPGGGAARRIAQMLSAGALGLIAAWILTYKAMTGKWPWEDKHARFLKIPVTGEARRSKLGIAIWGKDTRKDGELNFGFASPLVSRGARAIGAQGAADTALAGGNARQMLQGAKRDVLNTAIHPIAGPAVRAGLMAGTGKEAYLVNDREGGLTWMNGLPRKASIGSELKYAVRELNSFYGNVAAATGFEGPHDAGGDFWDHILRAVVEMTGLTANAQNPYATGKALADQRRMHR